jgi:hypothetical protein
MHLPQKSWLPNRRAFATDVLSQPMCFSQPQPKKKLYLFSLKCRIGTVPRAENT